ncbi:MAG: hypothetical protein NT170_03900 [Candidatus Moranbacteria bacterium]|nr:hypothetical protein [Candidatus Moranbacteria bacterium]
MQKSITKGCSVFLFALLLIGISNSANARSGCCSWHEGVSRCDTSTGRQVCNDGTYSPSCTCRYIPPKEDSQAKLIPLQIEKQSFANQWCGAGKLFASENDAKNSITDFSSQIREGAQKPLNKNIDELQKENGDLKSEIEKNKKVAVWSIFGWSIISNNN